MKLLFKAIRFFFSGYFNFIASLSSVIGLLIVIFTKSQATIIALVSLIIFLIIILFRFFSVTKTFILQKTSDGYHKFATYVRYSTEDGAHISYELHKYLQCKTIVMDEYCHEFHWSGSNDPIISSSLLDFKEFVRTQQGEYDKAIFKFKKPLGYNEFSIVHIKMELDDSDGKSKPYCEQTIKEPLQLLNFRVELRNKTTSPDAKILRRKINSHISEYENIDFKKFDTANKSYEYNVFNPEVGYYYRIEWVK